MSFAEEYKNMRNQGGAPKVTEEATKQAESAVADKAAAPPAEDPDSQIYAQVFQDPTLEQSSGATSEEPPVIPQPKIETKKSIKINGKTFETQEEAFEYAAQLDRDLEKEEAYKKGLEAAKPQEAKPAEKKKILKIAEKLFEDPDATFEELESHFEARILQKFQEMESEKAKAQQQVETVKQTWDNFYKTNSDLADWQQEVDLVLKREWSWLKDLPTEQGLAEIASLSRAYVSSVKERALPKSTLSSKPVLTPQGGMKSTTTTGRPATEKKVSFSEQVKSTNKRTVMQNEA